MINYVRPKGAKFSGVVENMHSINGLWLACAASERDLDGVCSDLCAWLKGQAGDALVQLAGASIHFDRSFIDVDLRALSTLLSHRQVDISALSRELRECGMDLPEFTRISHRAMDDCEAELAEWRALRRAVKVLLAGQGIAIP